MAETNHIGEACPRCGLVRAPVAQPGGHRVCGNCRYIAPVGKLIIATTENSFRHPETDDYWLKPGVLPRRWPNNG